MRTYPGVLAARGVDMPPMEWPKTDVRVKFAFLRAHTHTHTHTHTDKTNKPQKN